MLRKPLIAALIAGLFAAPPALAAAVSHAVATTDTTNDPNTSEAFTPAADDLLVVGICFSGTNDASPTLTSSVSGKTFTLAQATSYGSSGIHRLYIFVADQLASNESQTVTATAPNDTGTGTIIMVERVSGITRTGLDALRQLSTDPNNGSGATPDPAFAGAALTGNPTIGFLCNTRASGTNVTEPSGWTLRADVSHATPDNSGQVVTRDSGFTGTTITWGSTYGANGGAAAVEVDASAASTPAEFVDVTVNAAANGYDIDYEVTNENAQVYATACNPGDAASNQAELEAGDCGGGNDAIIAANEAATADVPGDLALTAAGKPPILDVYVGCAGGTGDCTLETHADEIRSPRSGYAIVQMVTHAAEGICGQDPYFDPDCDDLDAFEYKTTTEETPDCAVGISSTGLVTLTPSSEGACGGPGVRRTFLYSPQDYSKATDGCFTNPAHCFATDDTAAVNNPAPEFVASDVAFLWQKDVAISPLALPPRWDDVDGDVVTVTYQDSLPTGLTNNAGTLEGTPSACQSLDVTERGTDPFGDFAEVENTMVVGDLVPATSGLPEAATIAAIEAVCSFTPVAGTAEYSDTVALGDTIRTDPVDGWLSPPDQEVTYFLSLGPAPARQRGGRLHLGLGIW